MIRLPITLVAVALLGMSSPPAHAGEDPPATSLDGRSFKGKLWATGLFRWIRAKDTIVFKEGTFAWTSGIDAGYKPAPYETTEENGSVIFTVRSVREEGDYVDWSGVYDGESLSNVTAVWTRVEKDFVHDLLLPSKMTFIFKQR